MKNQTKKEVAKWIALILMIFILGYLAAPRMRELKIESETQDPKIQLQKEAAYQNGVDYNLQWDIADLQHRQDMVQLYLVEYAAGKITLEEMGAKIEAMEPRSKLLKIEKHELEWENE